VRAERFEDRTLTVRVLPGKLSFVEVTLGDDQGPHRGQPWVNSIGMRFVPVGAILAGVHPVRVADFARFSREMGRARAVPDFEQGDEHPVVLVTWDEAQAFCDWLTKHEIEEGKLAEPLKYRLPTDLEWSEAAGLPETGGSTPEERDGNSADFGWGKKWPPPDGAGNFLDATALELGARRPGSEQPVVASEVISGYRDGFARTSPVGTFAANAMGLYDMAGNVWQWVADPYRRTGEWGTLRGGSWATGARAELRLSNRQVSARNTRDTSFGFRVVLAFE
jgi:formylglycine-generating enzyme required for sulfatase activity